MIITINQDKPLLSSTGQSIIYCILIADNIQWGLRQVVNTQVGMSSIKRCFNISKLQAEGQWHTKQDQSVLQEIQGSNKKVDLHNTRIAKLFPKNGAIEFKNVEMKYRTNTDLVLKGVDFIIEPGEKVGCVGRTGAGKSSILVTLFRMTEIEKNGTIFMDKQDISQIGLHTLRGGISIIPQVPFLFSGTVRRNLDPLEQFRDEEIWAALEDIELKKTVEKLPDKLQTDMTNVNSVFSIGQQQLICLGRTILRDSQIIVLDEATANVDMKTDQMIQAKIKQRFSQSTVFTIAHRLNTIADYDKVIVLDQGQVAEFGHPFLLLARQTSDQKITSPSLFAQMVLNTGQENSRNIFEIAKQDYISKQIKTPSINKA